ncbi:MAG TPA: proton-conducting transporter membrane subunit, partial [Nannocystis sp.]
MTPAFDWAVWAVVLPLFGAAAAIVGPLRLGAWIGLVVGFALVVCAGGLASHLWRFGAYRHDIGGWPAPLGIGLSVDGLAAVMIGITAVIGACVGLYGAAYFTPRAPDDPAQAAARALRGRYFWPLAMLLWAALDALFLAADLFNLYVTLELLSLSAVALVALAGGPSLAAAMRYLLVSMLGSLAWLLGVALVYGRFAALDLAQLQPLVRGDAALATPLALMIGGALFKTALFPLHFWLPPAHAGAPAPVSALLSAVVVKATFYLVLRLWLMAVPSGLAAAGDLLGWLGVAAILWGGVLALRQRHLKSMLAYSTVSQLGYLFLAFPLAKTPNYAAAVWPAAVLFIAAHALGKAALFLA